MEAFLQLSASERREMYATAMPSTFLMRVSENQDRFATLAVLDMMLTMLWERKELRAVASGLETFMQWLSHVGQSKDRKLRRKVLYLRALLFLG